MNNDVVRMKILLSHNVIRPGTSGMVWAVFELETGSAVIPSDKPGEGSDVEETVEERLPLNLSLVLDSSGSMLGKPLEFVKDAARFVVQQMAAKDFLSLVTFDSEIKVIHQSEPVVNKDSLRSRIESICAGGFTNLSGGLLRGYQETHKNLEKGQVNRILLLTDGQANAGITSGGVLANKVASEAKKGISVSTVGVGAHFNEELLIQLSDVGQGHFYYVENPDQIPFVLAKELEGLLKIVAQGLQLRIEPSEVCPNLLVLGYKPTREDGGLVMHLPDMFENEVKRIVLGIEHTALQPGVHGIFSISGKYADALGDLDSVEFRMGVKLPVEEGTDEKFEPVVEVVKIVELTRAAIAKDEAAETLEDGKIEDGQSILKNQLNALNELSNVFEGQDVDVNEEIKAIQTKLEQMKEFKNLSGPCVDHIPTCITKDLRYQSYLRRRDRPKD